MKKVMVAGLVLIFGLISISLVITDSQAKEKDRSIQAKEKSSRADLRGVRLNIDKMKRDELGTDVQNIFVITVDPIGSSQSTYTVIYYLDDLFVEEFKGRTLPFTFRRNLKGVTRGAHTIKVEIENDNNDIVATQEKRVRVDFVQNKKEKMRHKKQNRSRVLDANK